MRCFSVNVRQEPTEYGFMPTLQLYLLEENDKQRPIVIIAPGGGYSTVLTDCDGDRVASQYNAAGFHAAVLRYSVKPHCFPEPQKDLMLAIRLLRENAAAWGIQEDGIVLCGFSAGGHLAASVSTLWHRSGESIYRPNAAILCDGKAEPLQTVFGGARRRQRGKTQAGVLRRTGQPGNAAHLLVRHLGR